MDDFLRETFLDNHLDGLAVLAAQEPEHLIEALEEVKLEPERAAKLVSAANELLNDQQKADRDEIIARRVEMARRAAEEEARALADAEQQAVLEAKAAGLDSAAAG